MYPKVNQHIFIDIISQEKSCRSIVSEIGEKEILIGFPMDGNIIGLLTDGTRLDITFMSGDDQFRFQTQIIGKKRENITLLRISKPQEKEIIRIQRRDNFRVNSNLRLMVNENELTIINISVGGVLFSTSVDFEPLVGEVISGILLLPNAQNKEQESIAFQGQIKRINLIETQERKNVAIAFTTLSQRDQMKIYQHCFEKQRQVRLKQR